MSAITSRKAKSSEIAKYECGGDGVSHKSCKHDITHKFSDKTYYCKKHFKQWVKYLEEQEESESESESSSESESDSDSEYDFTSESESDSDSD